MRRYILRRIIQQNECPGTCCKKTGAFPGSGTTRCIYFKDTIPGRLHGGCPFFNTDGTINQNEYAKLSMEDKRKFLVTCNNWPCPDTVPRLDTSYDEDFGQAFDDICPCFKWEVVDDGE